MSSGVTISVSPTGDVSNNNQNNNSSTTISPTNNWRIELNGDSNLTVQGYYDFINSGESPIKVIDSGTDVTNNAKITTTCWDSNNEPLTSCATMDCNNSYYVQHTATYNNKSKSVSRNLSAGC